MSDFTRVDGVIYVLLPVHDRRDATERFVLSLQAQTDRRFRLLLIDDGSTDGSAELVQTLLSGTATVLRGSGNWWWGGSLEQGRKWLSRLGSSNTDLVLIANNNTLFEPHFLEAGRATLARHRRSLALAQLYSANDGRLIEVGVRVDWRTMRFDSVGDVEEVNCFSTRGLLLRAADFVAIGEFHQKLLPHYLSDYEFTLRAKRQGFSFVSDPSFSLHYDEEASGRRAPDERSARRFLRTVFSRRAVENPIYWSTFILLACPTTLIPINLCRVWGRFISSLVRSAR